MVRAFVRAAGGRTIVVVALSREEPLVNGPGSVDLMRENGARDVRLFFATRPTDGDRALLAAQVRAGAAIWIPGGNQQLVPLRLGREWFGREIVPHLRVYGGTSAGAMCAADPMIAGPGAEKDTADLRPGLGLTSWLVDTHYRERKRQPRLAQAIRATGARRAVGLSERSWIVLDGDRLKETHGTVDVISGASRTRSATAASGR